MPITVRYDVPAALSGGASYYAGWARPMSARAKELENRSYEEAMRLKLEKEAQDKWERDRKAAQEDFERNQKAQAEATTAAWNRQQINAATQRTYNDIERARQQKDQFANAQWEYDRKQEAEQKAADALREQRDYAARVAAANDERAAREREMTQTQTQKKVEQAKDIKKQASTLWYAATKSGDSELVRTAKGLSAQVEAGSMTPEEFVSVLGQQIADAKNRIKVNHAEEAEKYKHEQDKLKLDRQARVDEQKERVALAKERAGALREAAKIALSNDPEDASGKAARLLEQAMQVMTEAFQSSASNEPIPDLLEKAKANDQQAVMAIRSRAKAKDPEAVAAIYQYIQWKRSQQQAQPAAAPAAVEPEPAPQMGPSTIQRQAAPPPAVPTPAPVVAPPPPPPAPAPREELSPGAVMAAEAASREAVGELPPFTPKKLAAASPSESISLFGNKIMPMSEQVKIAKKLPNGTLKLEAEKGNQVAIWELEDRAAGRGKKAEEAQYVLEQLKGPVVASGE